jgi:hypothetical protein
VFNKGICKGLNLEIPTGGHSNPNSTEGANLLWKNAQKNETKNNTSEIINKIMPQRNPKVTTWVCNPWKAPSRAISRHHWYIVNKVINKPKANNSGLKK